MVTVNHTSHIDSPNLRRQRRLQNLKDRKIERLTDKYTNVPIDQIERWVDEDQDDMDFRRTEQEFFLNDLKEYSDVPLAVTGTRWYHADRRIGRIWKSIHSNNISDGKDTIMVFRNGDTAVYRLSCERGQANGLLSGAISKGCTISKILVNYDDIH